MAILTVAIKEESSAGLAKGIEQSALGMILDNLQVSQYKYPVKSAVRELACNAIDAIAEREVARAILTGQAKEEDYYIRRDEDLYKDSNWDPTYYDLNWLSTESNVIIRYYDRPNEPKDQIQIIDEGVGLGGRRLQGYWNLGFSTKRNSKTGIGKFGIGAKAALSTGEPFYQVLTRYNGEEFYFNVYLYKVDSIIPPIDPETMEENIPHKFIMPNGEPYTYYGRKTTQKNGTIISIDVKRHKRQEYIDAIHHQLFYFQNIKLEQVRDDGVRSEIEVTSPILYEDDHIIIAKNSQYSKPHIVINRVNYGFVDFDELQLEHKNANVGIKVDMDAVSINPSRESLIWDDVTRAVIIETFDRAREAAQNLISSQMNTSDIINWISNSMALLDKKPNYNGTPIERIAGLIDLQELNPRWAADPSLLLGPSLFNGIAVYRVAITTTQEHDVKTRRYVTKKKFSVNPISTFRSITADDRWVISQGRPDDLALRYLADSYGNFILVRIPKSLEDADTASKVEYAFSDTYTPQIDEAQDQHAAYSLNSQVYGICIGNLGDPDFPLKSTKDGKRVRDVSYYITDAKGDMTEWKLSYDADLVLSALKARRARISGYFLASDHAIKISEVVVPADFIWGVDAEEQIVETESEEEKLVAVLSPEERRKLENRTLFYTPRPTTTIVQKTNFTWQKVEPTWMELLVRTEPVYFGTSVEDDTKLRHEESMLQLAAAISRPNENYGWAKHWDLWRENWSVFKKEYGLQNQSAMQDQIRLWNWLPGSSILLLRVSQDMKRMILKKGNFKDIREFFVTLNDKGELTMSDILITWNTARIVQAKISHIKFLKNYSQINQEIFQTAEVLDNYLQKYYRSINSVINHSTIKEEFIEQFLTFCDKLVNFQRFTQVEDNPELGNRLALELFNREVPGAIGADLSILDMADTIVDYVGDMYHVLNEVRPLCDYDKPRLSDELEREIRVYVQAKGH